MKDLKLARGVRDFPPNEKILRDKIIATVREVFELYGYNPIDLPILERYETLAAKFAAGEESDALKEIFVTYDNGKRKLGLRYDLTVPFSRFFGMNPQIKIPFKKYVMGTVFRDGPIKKGRYREFLQIDPDIVGCKNVLADAEILTIAENVFSRLGLNVVIELNSRKIINGILEDLNIPKKDWFDVIISIDKLKKIGVTEVEKELTQKGFKKSKAVLAYLSEEKTNKETLAKLKIKSPVGKEGIKEIQEILDYGKLFGLKNIKFLPSLARGLAYYTGPVYEIYLKNSEINSSVAGGGRYDTLIGNLINSKEQIPATGISFGVEVIVEAMKENLKQESISKVYVIPIGTKAECITIAQKIRAAQINTDMDLMERGISKNLEFANAYNIPYVLFVGKTELSQNKVKLRNMKTGKEEMLSVEEVIKKLS